MNNLQRLIAKMDAIEEGAVAECGGQMVMPGQAPKQQDNVSMNVNMTGQGANGIKDLMNILRNIEDAAGTDEPLVGDDMLAHQSDKMSDIEISDEDFGNSMQGASGKQTMGIDSVTPTGNDMFSKGREAPKVNGGGNPMQEALVARLQNLYNDVKLRESVSRNHRQSASHPRVSAMEHHKDGEFSAVVNGQTYHVHAPIDFGSSHDDNPTWLGSVTVKDPSGIVLHHNDPIFRAIDDELDKMDPSDLSVSEDVDPMGGDPMVDPMVDPALDTNYGVTDPVDGAGAGD